MCLYLTTGPYLLKCIVCLKQLPTVFSFRPQDDRPLDDIFTLPLQAAWEVVTKTTKQRKPTRQNRRAFFWDESINLNYE
ncbi:hypothetical protein COY16_01510 [Candidatus Roizmanbacteria bacterium CG_4_10_14_0_2_um_filter_39_13]|uniref:Uncharacterized protein n=1 Tax=Candidatus Roizmanbacteria bacterium CG_4_10_14_0_2_um_filter_39_13 TaxID=1974825 RepID=A0A2M7U0L1_9BACT|nr:MAG: hypothetical protein COY16_01510 [Candidatus Roizmanbacteria bacterium CG_4_10_14_0_2_um_filter_39_13]